MVCAVICCLCMTISGIADSGKVNYAVIGLKNAEGVTASEADIIADRLRIEMVNTGMVTMMERAQMQQILNEQGFQQSGACTDDACMARAGKVLGVERLVSGSIGKLGTKFLINVRAIDVQTAQILKVVSIDISGEIEAILQYLPGIAKQLVGVESEPVEVIESEPPAETAVQPPSQPAVVPLVESTESEERVKVSDKNENRFGVRFSFNWFPMGITPYRYNIKTDEYDEDTLFEHFDKIVDSLENEDYWDVEKFKLHFRFQVDFMIKAGQFVSIDVGPGFMLLNQYWDHDYNGLQNYYDSKRRILIIAPNMTTGVNFVKRFYPLKINAGFVLDVNANFIKSVYTSNTDTLVVTDHFNRRRRDVVPSVSFGPRVGVEIIAGPYFGFNIDFLYRYAVIETDIDLFEVTDQKWKFRLPGFGLGAGVNLYF